MKLTSKSSCFLRSMSQLVGRPSLVAILSNGKDSFWTSSWTAVSLAVCVRAVSDQRNINLQRPVCHHSKCFHESLFSFFWCNKTNRDETMGKINCKQKKRKCNLAVTKKTDVGWTNDKKKNTNKKYEWRVEGLRYVRLSIQSPVSRLRSLAASSDPSSLRSTSLRPIKLITDAREPGEAETWFPSTRSQKRKRKTCH